MKLSKLLPIAICILLITSIHAQKWHKIYDPIVDLDFCEIFENEDNTISILTNTSFTEHKFTKLNSEGEIIDEINFTLPINTYRPFDYIKLGSGDYAVICQTNFLTSNFVRVVKFNDAGLVYWAQNISSDNYDFRPSTLSLQANGNLTATGIAELLVNSNDDQGVFLAEFDTNNGELVAGFIFDTPLQYSAGVRVKTLDNGNFLCLEGENYENNINTYGSLGIRRYYILELTPEGEVVKRVQLGGFTGGESYQNKLDILSQDSILVVTNRTVFLLNSNFDIVWIRKTDLNVEEVKVDKSKEVIAITGKSFANVENKGPSILLIDFSGNVISSKTHVTESFSNSSSDDYGLDIIDNGYILASVRRKDSDLYYLECYKTDVDGLVDNFEVVDIYSTCDEYPLLTPGYSPPANDCGDDFSISINSKVTSTDLICTFGTLSNRIQTITRTLTDSCGGIDTIIQLIHYEEVAPTIDCCDYEIISQDEDGASVQFSPVNISSSCRPYTLYHLDTFDLDDVVYFPNGVHSINFLLVNEDCFTLDSFYQSYNIEISFIDIDGDGFEASEDCDDMDANVNPDQEEEPYNGIDDDCDPLTLDDDLDQDGFILANDCDDANAEINPNQEENPYNGIDEDCDPTTLDDDLDEDGFLLADDCDDNNAEINPNQVEEPYNGFDDDCNPLTLDDDLDEDGFLLVDDCDDNNDEINPNQIEEPYNEFDDDCNPLTLDDDLDQDGFLLVDDCDDNNDEINPNQIEEPYNGIDDDCDPLTLDDDLDQDGFLLIDDCDDNNADINPDADEIPNNGIDENCDGEDLVLSIHEIANAKINIYPNPATDFIVLEVEGNLDFKAIIYDYNGKILFEKSHVNKIDLSNYLAGTYLIEIRDLFSKSRIVEKIVIVK